MKYILITIFSLTYIFCFGQNETAQINKEVWIPFIAAFSAGNEVDFLAVHSKDVIRLNLEEGTKLDYETYLSGQKELNQYYKKANKQKMLELRFIHRSADAGFAYQTGFYKSSTFDTIKYEQHDLYGKFNVILKKESGTWKILVDADHGGVNKEQFDAAKALDDFQK